MPSGEGYVGVKDWFEEGWIPKAQLEFPLEANAKIRLTFYLMHSVTSFTHGGTKNALL